MSLRDDLLPVINEVRAIPGLLGFRPYTVAIEVITWSGSERGEGTKTTTTTPITEAGGQPPRVRWLDNEEIALGGYDKPTVEVGPITPDFSDGGTSLATLKARAAEPNSEVYYVLTGPDFPSGARFVLVADTSDRPLRYMVKLQRAADA